MNNISGIESCYGCGVCAMACGKKIIDIKVDKEGFYSPYITDESKCVNCGLCVEVCSYCHDDLSVNNRPLASYAGWSNEPGVRRVSASGGVGFEISRSAISNGSSVVAVRYNVAENRAEHYIADSVEALLPSMGSKYIQSFTLDAFRLIDRRKKYLITGTPCQIDSFRRLVRRFKCEDNFLLMDFFCHGVPSRLVWDKYLKNMRKMVGEIEYVSWRNKQNGWHDSWIMAFDGENGEGETVDWHDSYNLLIKGKKHFVNVRASQGDLFYSMFFGNNCLGKACYKKCKFKYCHSSADIRIGDLWGDTYSSEDKGVTACVAFTEKGERLLKESNCELVEHPFETVAEGQIEKPLSYPAFTRWLLLNMAKCDFVSIKMLALVNRISNGIRRRIIK